LTPVPFTRPTRMTLLGAQPLASTAPRVNTTRKLPHIKLVAQGPSSATYSNRPHTGTFAQIQRNVYTVLLPETNSRKKIQQHI
jgi:hypothetical protein